MSMPEDHEIKSETKKKKVVLLNVTTREALAKQVTQNPHRKKEKAVVFVCFPTPQKCGAGVYVHTS